MSVIKRRVSRETSSSAYPSPSTTLTTATTTNNNTATDMLISTSSHDISRMSYHAHQQATAFRGKTREYDNKTNTREMNNYAFRDTDNTTTGE